MLWRLMTWPPEPLTPAGFAPFGDVIEPAVGGEPINQGSAWRTEAIEALDLTRDAGRAVLALYQAQAQGRDGPIVVRQLERHRWSDQVFLPMGAPLRLLVLVAADNGSGRPGPLRMFLGNGRQGVRLRAGTWHHGLLSLDAGCWAVLERRAMDGRVDCELFDLNPTTTLPALGDR
jgi:ureidoglycolate lyase